MNKILYFIYIIHIIYFIKQFINYITYDKPCIYLNKIEYRIRLKEIRNINIKNRDTRREILKKKKSALKRRFYLFSECLSMKSISVKTRVMTPIDALKKSMAIVLDARVR